MSSYRIHFAAAMLLSLLALASCSSQPEEGLLLSEAPNFREVGGYATTDGRHLKQGVLYRSDELDDLSRADLKVLDSLGINQVIDLRHENERADSPDRLPEGNRITVVELPVLYGPLDRAESRRKILDAEVEEGHFYQLLIEANRSFALDFTDEWAQVLRDVASKETLPVLIHCVDGKDRTGFVIALILRAVDVPMDVVLEDYLLSNDRLQDRIDRLSFLAFLGSLFRVPRSEILPLMEVRPAYLEAAFGAIDEQYGSLDVYLREGLGLEEETLARLRLALLE